MENAHNWFERCIAVCLPAVLDRHSAFSSNMGNKIIHIILYLITDHGNLIDLSENLRINRYSGMTILSISDNFLQPD